MTICHYHWGCQVGRVVDKKYKVLSIDALRVIDEKEDIAHCPKILTRAINSSGPDQLSQWEKVLNWKTENALTQNQLLTSINNKVDQLSVSHNKRLRSLQISIIEIHVRLNNHHQEMTTMAQHMMVNTSNFRSKKAETASLNNQLKDLQKSLEIARVKQIYTSIRLEVCHLVSLCIKDPTPRDFTLDTKSKGRSPLSPGFYRPMKHSCLAMALLQLIILEQKQPE